MPIDIDEIVLPEEKTVTDLETTWNVLVFDDPVNLMSFVTLVFKRIFGYDQQMSEKLMLEVHNSGKSVVWSGAKEKAEFYVQQLQSYQLKASMQKA